MVRPGAEGGVGGGGTGGTNQDKKDKRKREHKSDKHKSDQRAPSEVEAEAATAAGAVAKAPTGAGAGAKTRLDAGKEYPTQEVKQSRPPPVASAGAPGAKNASVEKDPSGEDCVIFTFTCMLCVPEFFSPFAYDL